MNKVFSFWEKTVYEQVYDFVIVGAGLTGLSTAIHLKSTLAEKRILVIEKGVIPYGASTKNAGFACFGSIGELEDDRHSMSIKEIVDTVEMRYNGLHLLRSMVPDKEMKYDNCGGIELFESQEDYEKAAAQIDFWNKELLEIVGPEVFKETTHTLPGFYPKAINNAYEGALNPAFAIEFLWAKAQKLGVSFLCGTEVKSYEKANDQVHIKTSLDLNLKAKEFILCTNAFTQHLMPELDIIPARNQVLITKPLDVNPLKSCYHFDKGYVYFRQVGNRILLGGARNISSHENTAEYGNTEELQTHLASFLKKNISKEAEVDYWWSGIIATGSAKKPLIKKLNNRISFGLRLSGMGVAIGTFVGKQLAELHIK